MILSEFPTNEDEYISFEVSTNKTALQFSYISVGSTSANLYVELAGQRQLVNINIENNWTHSECMTLPDNFSGNIKLGLQWIDNDTTFIAVDNVILLDKDDCTGKLS